MYINWGKARRWVRFNLSKDSYLIGYTQRHKSFFLLLLRLVKTVTVVWMSQKRRKWRDKNGDQVKTTIYAWPVEKRKQVQKRHKVGLKFEMIFSGLRLLSLNQKSVGFWYRYAFCARPSISSFEPTGHLSRNLLLTRWWPRENVRRKQK